jgi:hypothetical protein
MNANIWGKMQPFCFSLERHSWFFDAYVPISFVQDDQAGQEVAGRFEMILLVFLRNDQAVFEASACFLHVRPKGFLFTFRKLATFHKRFRMMIML